MKVRLGAVLCLLVLAAEASGAEKPVLKNQKEIVSYGIGVNMAKSFKKDEVEFDINLIVKGLKDATSGKRLLVPERELRKAMNVFQGELRRKEMLNHRIAADDNKQKGETFLAENKNKAGVTTLPSGVQYKVISAGDGRTPTDGDLVECHYRGMLLDGTEFDGTEDGKPRTLKVSQLIEGWRDALKHMPAGSKWQIFIPPQLAYGTRGVGSDIGPNATLMFEVDLVAIK